MKTKTTITELTQDDLVHLLCTATYGSKWLECSAPDCEGVDISCDDCREDIWAKCLLAGKPLGCINHYADGVIYGDKGNAVVSDEDGDESVCYLLYLEDFIDGLQKCVDGTFKTESAYEKQYMFSCFNAFKEEAGFLDMPMAEDIMQIVMFGEIIYG